MDTLNEIEKLRRENRALKEQYRQAQETIRLKNEFLISMSHDLLNPLNSIIGFSELMYSEKIGIVSAHHKEYLGDILHCSKKLLRLIHVVIDSGKIQSCSQPINIQFIDTHRNNKLLD